MPYIKKADLEEFKVRDTLAWSVIGYIISQRNVIDTEPAHFYAMLYDIKPVKFHELPIFKDSLIKAIKRTAKHKLKKLTKDK